MEHKSFVILVDKNDTVVGLNIISKRDLHPELDMLVLMEHGYGKRTKLNQYKKQQRGGVGIKTAKVTPKTGPLVSVQVVAEDAAEIIAISQKGQVIRAPLDQIPSLSRATQGVRVMKLEPGDKVASVTLL